MQDLFAESIAALLADHATPTAVRLAGGQMDPGLWTQLTDAGYDQALVPEALGGAGLGFGELGAALQALGRHAAPVPLGEAMLARGWGGAAGIALPPGAVSVGSAQRVGDEIIATAVPWALDATCIVALLPDGAAMVFSPADALSTELHAGLHPNGECDLRWRESDALQRFALPPGADAFAAGAALRVAQIAGALDTVLEQVLAYAAERRQFGRAIAKFQAIQQQIAVLAEDVFAARMAAALAFSGGQTHGLDSARVAAAKVVASEAAARSCAIAHAVLGAMGIAEEHDLQLFTRRLLAWRMQYGSEAFWSARLGRGLLDGGQSAWTFARELAPA